MLRLVEELEDIKYGVKVEDNYGDVYVIYTSESDGSEIKDFVDNYIHEYMDAWDYDEDENIPADEFAQDVCAELYRQYHRLYDYELTRDDYMDEGAVITLKDGSKVKVIAEYDDFTY